MKVIDLPLVMLFLFAAALLFTLGCPPGLPVMVDGVKHHVRIGGIQ